jgi:hypothetical protein
MLRNRKLVLGLIFALVLFLAYVIVGRQIPIHASNSEVGSERIYYIETSRMIDCDVAYFEVVVHEDQTYEYVYELISVGNGSCLSDLYIWKGFRHYRLSEAIKDNIISLNDFLESDLVVQRPKQAVE